MVNYDFSWKKYIEESKFLDEMVKFVNSADNICPVKDKVFRFLETDFNNIKCIILGMDPYPATYKKNGIEVPVATGRSFEVANIENFTDKYKQTSLANIFKTLWYMKYNEKISMKEIRCKCQNNDYKLLNIHKWFDEMEKQGVIFLNVTLTTEMGKSGVHIKKWELYMNELIKFISNNVSEVKWLVWGKQALDRINGLVSEKNIVYTCHPASRINNTFIDDCCFKKINSIVWFD